MGGLNTWSSILERRISVAALRHPLPWPTYLNYVVAEGE